MPSLLQWQIDEYTTRRTALEAEITALDQVIAQYIANPAGSYTLNTGQTMQQVSRVNIQSYIDLRAALRAERWSIMEALFGSGRTAYFRPDF